MESLTKKSPLKMGWVLVMFDLPVLTRNQRKEATDFRKNLLDDGFFMVQYSVYARACTDLDRVQKHTDRLRGYVPHAGNVRIQHLTDLQWAKGETITGKDYPQGNRQLELDLPQQAEFW